MSYERAKAYLEKVGGMEYVHHRELYIDTVEDAAKSIGCTEAEIAKSLTFMVDGKPIMIVMAGDTKPLRKPWKVIIDPRVNFPFIARPTPITSTAELAIVESAEGIIPRYWLILANFTFWVLTDAW